MSFAQRTAYRTVFSNASRSLTCVRCSIGAASFRISPSTIGVSCTALTYFARPGPQQPRQPFVAAPGSGQRAAHEVIAPKDAERADLRFARRPRQRRDDLGREPRRHALVGVDHQRPLGAHLAQAEIALPGEIGKRVQSDLRSGGGRGVTSAVVAPRVHDENVRRKAQRRDAGRDLMGLVSRDDDGGQ